MAWNYNPFRVFKTPNDKGSARRRMFQCLISEVSNKERKVSLYFLIPSGAGVVNLATTLSILGLQSFLAGSNISEDYKRNGYPPGGGLTVLLHPSWNSCCESSEQNYLFLVFSCASLGLESNALFFQRFGSFFDRLCMSFKDFWHISSYSSSNLLV